MLASPTLRGPVDPGPVGVALAFDELPCAVSALSAPMPARDLRAGVSLRAMRVVAAVAAAGGVSPAARALHQSPAAITRAVQGAELILGLALFERGARGMVPTAAGEALALRATRALQALEAGAQGLRAMGSPAAVASLPRQVTDAQLQALVARASHPTEAAAAAAVGLSQPALNQALRSLAHAARAPLYQRTRQGLRLSEAGEWLLQQVKLALAEIRVAHEEVARWCGPHDTEVAIGALPMASDVLVPQAAALAMHEQPRLRISVRDGTYESLMGLLRVAELDFVVGPLRGDGLAPDLVEEALYVDRFVAVVRAGHPVLAHGPADLHRLAAYPWIGPLPGTPAQAAFERLLASAGLDDCKVMLRSHSSPVIRSMLLSSDLVALVSPLQVQAEVQAGLLAVASAPLVGSERPIGITQRRGALASSACNGVLAGLRHAAVWTPVMLPG